MDLVIDGIIDAYCVPECARCEVTGMHPNDFEECPEAGMHRGESWECDPDCPHYTEDWENEED